MRQRDKWEISDSLTSVRVIHTLLRADGDDVREGSRISQGVQAVGRLASVIPLRDKSKMI